MVGDYQPGLARNEGRKIWSILNQTFVKVTTITQSPRILMFADAAQNRYSALSTDDAWRHGNAANIVFWDGHAQKVKYTAQSFPWVHYGATQWQWPWW